MMERVYFVEDGLGYGERAVFGPFITFMAKVKEYKSLSIEKVTA